MGIKQLKTKIVDIKLVYKILHKTNVYNKIPYMVSKNTVCIKYVI